MNSDGLLIGDRPVQFKVQGIVQLPFDLLFSTNYRHLTGRAWGRTIRVANLGIPTTIRAEVLDGHRRLPDVDIADMRIQRSFVFGGNRRASIFIDSRANAAQRKALVAMVRSLSGNLIGSVVQETAAPIQFADNGHQITVATDTVKLAVAKHLNHDASCGNKQWFNPLTRVDRAEMGTTDQNAFSGPALCTKWSDPNKRSSFFGTFSY